MVGEVSDVLERVIIEVFAVGLVSTHEESKAVKLGWLDSFFDVDVLKDGLENTVSAHSHLDVLVKFFVSFFGTFLSDHVVEVVKSSISGVDRRVLIVFSILGRAGNLLKHLVHERDCLLVINTLEVTNWFLLVTQVTELLDMRLGSLSLNGGVLFSKGFTVDTMSIRIFHPLNGEGITEAGVHVPILDYIIGVAVVTPRAFGGIGSSHSVDTCVRSEFREHGTRFTSLNVENELVEHFLLSHGVDGSLKLIGIEVGGRESNKTWSTVIGEVDENLGV